MNQGYRFRRIFFFFASAALFLALANPAQAKDRAWNIGIGSSSGTVTNVAFASQGTDEDASGIVFNVGYAFNKWIAIEAMHTTVFLDTLTISGISVDQDVTAINFGARAMLPLGPVEIFGRFGFGTYFYAIDYSDSFGNTYNETFSGGGGYSGFGAAITLGRFGIEAGVTEHDFEVSGTDSAGNPINEDLTYKAFQVILSIQFGRDLK